MMDKTPSVEFPLQDFVAEASWVTQPIAFGSVLAVLILLGLLCHMMIYGRARKTLVAGAVSLSLAATAGVGAWAFSEVSTPKVEAARIASATEAAEVQIADQLARCQPNDRNVTRVARQLQTVAQKKDDSPPTIYAHNGMLSTEVVGSSLEVKCELYRYAWMG